MRYLVYGRVSPKGSDWDKGETSIPDQVAQCRAYILTRDPAAEISVVEDQFQSAATARRPGYSRILEDLQARRADWDVLVVRHLDRLSRSLTDAVDLLRLLQDNGKGLVSITQNLDLASPTGRAMLSIILVFAQWEREINSERTRSKMVSIAAAGCWPVGHPPLGYARGQAHDNVLRANPKTAGIVQAIFRDYAGGGIGCVELAKRYGLVKQQILNMLRNQVYIGKLPYAGQVHAGKHDPIITPDLWAAVQARLPQRSGNHHLRPAQAKHEYLLAGVVWCECGGQMSPGSANGRASKYNYYQCRCGARIRAELLEGAAVDHLSKRRLTDKEISAIVAEQKRRTTRTAAEAIPELEQARSSLASEQARLSRMKTSMLDGLVSKANADEWNTDMAACRARINELTGHLEALKAKARDSTLDPDTWVAVAGALRSLRHCIELAKDDPPALRQLVLSYVSRVTRVSDLEYTFEFAGLGSPTGVRWLAMVDFNEPDAWPSIEGRLPRGIPRRIRRRIRLALAS